jgi:predicted nucleic acid-binding protein
MSFLLDTNVCSAYLKNVRSVCNRFLQHGGLHTSAVTLAELEVWLLRRATPSRFRQGYWSLRRNVTILDLGRRIARRAGRIGADLKDQGLKMALPDLLIAATALVHNLTLVTHNTSDFVNVPGLTMTDWMIP